MIRALAPIDPIRAERGGPVPDAHCSHASLERDAVDLKRAQHIAHCGPRTRYRRQPATGAKANRTLPTSERRITRDGDPMHAPTLARVIVERAVLGAAVVPDRQRTNLPAESAGKLWLNGMRHQKIENRPRLGALETVERLRVIAYVERSAAGLRVGPHKWMRGLRLQVAGVADLGGHLLVADVTAVSRGAHLIVPAQLLAIADVPGLDALEHLFHWIG